MKDPRIKKLAHTIINYSCSVKKGEKIMINTIGGNEELTRELVKETYKVGGMPFVVAENAQFKREMLLGMTKEQAEFMAKHDCAFMSDMQAFVGVRGGNNTTELSDVPTENMKIFNKYHSRAVNDIRVPHTKWVVLRYPTASMAQMAKMSTEAFEDFYFDVCNLDYKKMGDAMNPLVELMNKTDKVRLLGPGDTDLTFSIKDIPAIKCDGIMNIPDGEVYTAPVKNSVNGVIHYNAPSPHDGFTYEDVRLEFKDGKIVDSTANDTNKIKAVFDSDEGARYVGEFAIGVNPNITQPMGDILFDEKIAGSIHFTPGQCYDEASNGNKSSLHWDLVMIQTPEYGGGEIYFDDVLVRKDGLFVVKELLGLNPENLK